MLIVFPQASNVWLGSVSWMIGTSGARYQVELRRCSREMTHVIKVMQPFADARRFLFGTQTMSYDMNSDLINMFWPAKGQSFHRDAWLSTSQVSRTERCSMLLGAVPPPCRDRPKWCGSNFSFSIGDHPLRC